MRLINLLYPLLFVACARLAAAPQTSPSGNFTIRTEIAGDEAGPSRRLCVRLVVHEIATHKDLTFQTGASDGQKWAVAWSPTNALVLYSSDIGTNAYDIKGGVITQRAADSVELEAGRGAYATKYGVRPRN